VRIDSNINAEDAWLKPCHSLHRGIEEQTPTAGDAGLDDAFWPVIPHKFLEDNNVVW